jgi:hypothetical protein
MIQFHSSDPAYDGFRTPSAPFPLRSQARTNPQIVPAQPRFTVNSQAVNFTQCDDVLDEGLR